MPIGANGGGQLNILVFQVGFITRDEVLGVELAKTVSVHPLVVAPSSITYQDNSLTSPVPTLGGIHSAIAGRAPRQVMLSGTFGGDAVKGLAIYLGNGPILLRRFYNEVVRMGEALSQDDVDACVDILTGSIAIWATVLPYDPERSTFFINFFDFWSNRSFSVVVKRWQETKSARGGSATGVTQYQMVLGEAGPLVEGTLIESLISGLMAGLAFLDSLSNVLSSYTLGNIAGSFLNVVAIGASELSDLVEGVQDQLSSLISLMSGNGGGFAGSSTAAGALASLQTSTGQMVAAAEALAASLDAARSDGEPQADGPAVDYEGAPGEGDQLDVAAFEASADLLNLATAGQVIAGAGAYFAMSPDEYADFLASGGSPFADVAGLAGSLEHTVMVGEVLSTLEERYGIAAEDLLAINNLLPDDVRPGRRVLVPRRRPRGPSGIQGLPVFGSHIGKAAWGVDVDVLFEPDSTGDLRLVEEEDCLIQGVEIIVDMHAPDVLQQIDAVPPPARELYLRDRLSRAVLGDRRVRAVADFQVALDPSGAGYSVTASLNVVNGGSIRVGG